MGKEIERKYMILNKDFMHLCHEIESISQGYLSEDPNRCVRVRKSSLHGGTITVKGISSLDGLERFEFEKKISYKETKALLNLCPKVLRKVRYHVMHTNNLGLPTQNWEVDVFTDIDLVIAEIEFESIKASQDMGSLPEWVGDEVSGETQYYNLNLLDRLEDES